MPFNIKKWVDENKHLLKPPVNNYTFYKENDDFIVMIVGGPNERKDYHFNEGEELFYQLEGDIVLKTIINGVPRDIPIKEGDLFLLPPRTPHSPQRPANTLGLVIERYRTAKENDGFMWFCENCGNKLYEDFFPLTNIVTQLPEVMESFYSSEELRTCEKCNAKMKKP